MSECVLDSSVLLAYLQEETGYETITALLEEASMSTVNLAEVAAKMAERGASMSAIRLVITPLDLNIVPFDEDAAYVAADLRTSTRALGLSLGDRACLATAKRLGMRAVTADRKWGSLDVGVKIQVIR